MAPTNPGLAGRHTWIESRGDFFFCGAVNLALPLLQSGFNLRTKIVNRLAGGRAFFGRQGSQTGKEALQEPLFPEVGDSEFLQRLFVPDGLQIFWKVFLQAENILFHEVS
jgi:hypothetical protein